MTPSKPVYEWDRTEAERQQREQDAIVSRTPFPIPDARTLPFPRFCEYWNKLIEQPVSKYARIYVRRWFPVLLPEEIEDARSGLTHESHPSEKKYTKDDGPLDEKRILSDIGVGDYTFRLNDSRRPWDQATIVHGEKLSTMRNWDLYPPVFDKKRLDWDDEANKVFIKWAQSRNFLPQDRDIQKEQADMASEQIVTQLLQQNKQLTDQVVNSSAKPAPTPAPAPPSKAENGETGAVKAVVDFATAALSRPTPQAADPMAMVQGLVSIIKEIKPAPDTSATDLAKQVVAQAEAANTRIYELQKDQMKDIRAELDKARTPPAAVTPPAPLTRRQMLEDAVAEQTLLKQLSGRGAPAAEEAEKPSSIDKWLEAAPIIAPVIQSVIQGIFQTVHYGLETWQKVSLHATLAKNGQSVTTMTPETKVAAEPSKPQPTPEQQAQQQKVTVMLKALEDAAKPILLAFNRGESGDSTSAGANFADTIITFKGRPDYDLIRSMGEKVPGSGDYDFETFRQNVGWLMEHPNRGPETAQLFKEVSQKPSFRQFLLGFLNYDAIRAEMQRQQEER